MGFSHLREKDPPSWPIKRYTRRTACSAGVNLKPIINGRRELFCRIKFGQVFLCCARKKLSARFVKVDVVFFVGCFVEVCIVSRAGSS